MSNNAKCRRCKYGFGQGWCDYIGATNKRRPCPPGKECTVYEPLRGAKEKNRLPAPMPKADIEPEKEPWNVTAQLNDQLTAMWEQGLTDYQISAETGLNHTTIGYWRRKRGLPTQRERRNA